jgi:L-aminopeptidase/D-esterase-like protein
MFVQRLTSPEARWRWCLTPIAAAALLAAVLTSAPDGQARPRARDLGVPFEGSPGPLNAITDVAGVTVGHATIISGEGPLVVGKGPVRTGVTAVLPRGSDTLQRPCFGAWFSLNGNGEMTGTTWVEESGFLEGPVLITNTHSVGVVRDAAIAWRLKAGPADASGFWWALPVVAETWDGYLNDINGMHVKPEHVFHALDRAAGGRVAEGSVGGGPGMVCYGFKGGIGTASRRLASKDVGYTVGVLVQANFGLRAQLMVAGAPVGREIPEGDLRGGGGAGAAEAGSVIAVVATDAPLLPHQLKRLARRVSLGLARTGAMSGNGSGDIFIAFSTANPGAFGAADVATVEALSNENISPLFDATALATEEAVVNALVASDTMTGANNRRVVGLPHDRLREVLRKYNRLVNPAS